MVFSLLYSEFNLYLEKYMRISQLKWAKLFDARTPADQRDTFTTHQKENR